MDRRGFYIDLSKPDEIKSQTLSTFMETIYYNIKALIHSITRPKDDGGTIIDNILTKLMLTTLLLANLCHC